MWLIKKFSLVVVALLMGTTVLIAQDSGRGQVEGVVTDEVTGEALIGASVMIGGTTLGSPTNADGEYVIRRVPEGNQVLRISYLGYRTMEREVEVIANETIEVNIELAPEALEGEDVVVSAQAAGQKSAINEQIGARSIKNVVSADKIRELPDENAATALSRLPGVSLQDGDKVVIRGIQASQNMVMVNGIQLPSTDVNNRSTNLGFISSNMLSGIEVTKAVTPDMDHNTIGGVVNLRLQEAPEDFHFDVLAQGGYNTQDATADNYQVWASLSNRFLDNRLGAFAQINTSRQNGGSDFSLANYSFIYDGPTTPPVGQAKKGMQSFIFGDNVSITDQRGGSIILDYKLPNGELLLQNTYAFTENNNTSHRDVLTLTTQSREFQTHRDIHNKHLIVNAFQAANDFGFVEVDLGVSHAFSKKNTDLRYGEDYGHAFRYDGGNAFTPPDPDQSIDRDYRLTLTPEDIYDFEFSDEYWQRADFLQNGGTRDEDFSERALSGVLNFTVPVNITDNITGIFKTGGKYSMNIRENDLERYTSRINENPRRSNELAADWMIEHGMDPSSELQFVDFRDEDYGDGRGSHFLGGDFDMTDVIDTELMDQYIRLASPGWGRFTADSRAYDYEGKETNIAGYGMFDFQIGSKLEILGGVRYEHFNADYETALVLRTHDQDGTARIANESDNPEMKSLADSLTNSDNSIDHWLPNLQLRYKFNEWVDLRLAYTKTLSRPDYQAIVPRVYSGNRQEGEAGNPNLKPTVSDNYDAYLSFYNNQIGLFTIGGFYKHMENVFYEDTRQFRTLADDIIYPTNEQFDRLEYVNPNPSAAITTYFNNPEPAKVYGFEVEWQTHFWYLPKPFNSVVLNINYTRAFSEMDYQQTRYESEFICNDLGQCTNETVQIDTSRTGRLLHQGDNIVNIALGADHKGFSGRVSFRMQGDVITQIGARPEDDAFTGNIYGWDFTLRQRLPVEGLSIFANGINIFHTPTKDYQEFLREDDGEILRNLRQTSYNPRRFQLGIRYSF